MLVSSANSKVTAETQKKALIQAGVNENLIYEDRINTLNQERPQLQRVLDILKEGDVLCVWKINRLARNTPHLMEIAQTLNEKKITLISLQDDLNTSLSERPFFHILSILVQFEADLTREKIMEGLEEAKKRGSKLGRPSSIPEEKLCSILEAVRQGQSKRDISKIFEVKKTTLFKMLKRYKQQQECDL